MITPEKLLEAAKQLEPQLQEWRRTLHRHPEVGFDLPQTKALVKNALTEMGYAPQDCGKCGVLALAGGKKPGKVILLRGDMDALPLQEESGEDRCPGMWFDSGSLALDTQELLEIADSLGREQGLSVDMGELTVLLVLYGLTITAEIPRSLEDEEKLSFLDWAIQETGLPTEFTAERVMGSVRSQPFRYAMYVLRRQFFYWVQVLAERCDRDGDGERFRELFCTILEDAEEQWVENHPGGALRQGAEAFCRDALEEFARQLLRRRCAPF